MSEKIKVIVATHKKAKVPQDKLYLPVHVGAFGKNDFDGMNCTRDDTGDHISQLNYCFGSQTGLYWAWKNLNAEYKGLVHYRRYFTGVRSNKDDMVGSAITYDEISPLLGKIKVFVPKKRWYIIETLYSHYMHTHGEEHLVLCKKIIQVQYPEYMTAFNKVMGRRWGYMFNMMILRTDLMDDYCSWLFDILFQLFEQVDRTKLSEFDIRFGGRMSERLFDVWLEKKFEDGTLKKDEVKELPYMEDVNWAYKIKVFLAAKFLHKKYIRSS